MDKHARILVVDDDENIRNSLAIILRAEGYTVDLVVNGSEAIQKTESTAYNVALIDMRLPDMEGTKLLTGMKDTVPKISKIIITGYPSMQNAIETVNRKADAYIVKPVDVEQLLNTLREQLELQENEKKYSQQKVIEFIESRVKEVDAAES